MALKFNPIAAASRFLAALVRRGDPQRQRSFYGRSFAGEHVTHDRAEQVSAVWACMDVIASALSSSDWNVYAGARGDDKKQALPADSLQYILNTRWNEEMTAQAGKRAVALAAVGWGTGYAEIVYDLSGRITALWPIHPQRVEGRRDAETGRLFFRIMQESGGGWVDMDPEDLFIVRGASLVGFVGDDQVARAVRTIAIAIALDEFSGAFFGNGAHVGGSLKVPGKLDDVSFRRLQDQIDEKKAGARNAFRPFIAEGGAEYQPYQMDAEKAQLVDSKYLSIEEICRWFRVPPHKIAHLLRATNNNIEHQGLEFTRDTLRPWVKEIEQEADYKLIPYRGPPKFVEIDVDWAEQGDYKSRMEAYARAIAAGIFSPNVVLRKLGENTIGPKGDIYMVQGAMIPLERVGESYQATGTPTKPESPSDPATEETSAPAAGDGAST